MRKAFQCMAFALAFITLIVVCSAFPIRSGLLPDGSENTYSNSFYHDFLDDDDHDTSSEPTVDFNYTANQFNAVQRQDYYNYGCLTDTQKSMYNTIFNAMVTMQSGNIYLGNGTKRDAALALYAVKYDNPQLFWLGYEYGMGTDDENNVFIRLDSDDVEYGYIYTQAERISMMAELQSAVSSIIKECVSPEMSQYEKELALHDWICNNVEYDHKSGENAINGNDSDADHEAWTAYGALINKKAVCEGYSKAFQLLLYNVGINSNLICGYTDDRSAHMWNSVNIDGKWYHVDVLWDDVEEAEYSPSHAFFNVTTAFINKTHTIYPDSSAVSKDESIFVAEYNITVPSCTSNDENFYVKENTLISSDNEFQTIVISAFEKAAAASSDCVEFFYNYKDINNNIVSFDIKHNRIFSNVKHLYDGIKGLKYEVLSYGSFVIKISK